MNDNEHCPRCQQWRTSHAEVSVLYGPMIRAQPSRIEVVQRSVCANCGIFWFSDKPQFIWKLDREPA